MEDENVFLVGILIGLVIGIVLIIIVCSTLGNEVITTKVLDESCKEIYGTEYKWKDNVVGTETQLVCEKIKKEIKTDKSLIIKVE